MNLLSLGIRFVIYCFAGIGCANAASLLAAPAMRSDDVTTAPSASDDRNGEMVTASKNRHYSQRRDDVISNQWIHDDVMSDQ